jgi:Fe-S-cluster containining protein
MRHSDPDKPWTWQPYREGLCQGCRAGCCTMPVEIRAEDLQRLGLASEDEVRGSRKKLFKRLHREGILKSYRAGTDLFMLEQKNGTTDCYFLGPNRLCTVYERRPDVCRQFPSIGPRPGYCPAAPK